MWYHLSLWSYCAFTCQSIFIILSTCQYRSHIAPSLVNLSFIILRYHLSIYCDHIPSLLVNLSFIILRFHQSCTFNLSLSYWAITCQSIVIILRFHFLIYRHHIVAFTCQSIVIILRFHLLIYRHHTVLLSIYRHHIALSLFNLSSSYCYHIAFTCFQSIVLILHHIYRALSLLNLSSIILSFHLSIYRDHHICAFTF